MIDIHDRTSRDKGNLFGYLGINSFCSERYKLFYVATPKVACTSLKWWFAEIEGISSDLILATDSDESDPELVIHDALGKVSSGITGLSPSELEIPIISEDYFRFAVVRNPYKRIFSAWQSKILLQEPLQAEPFLNCDFCHRPIKCVADIASLFEEFLEHIATFPEEWLDAHWKPQADLLRPDIISYSLISRIEEPEILVRALREHVKFEIVSPFAANHKNVSLIPYSREFVTDRSAELIGKMYAQDFIAFGYDIAPPESKNKISSDLLKTAIHGITLVRGRNKQIANIRRSLNEQIRLLGDIIATRDNQIMSLDSELTAVYSSHSWMVTRPLRAINSLLHRSKLELKKLTTSLKRNGIRVTVFKIIMRLRRGLVEFPSITTDTFYSTKNAIDDQKALEETFKKKLTLISMVKNEKGILETFAGHALGLFDRIILVDHRSTDGTKEYIKALSERYPAVEFFSFDEPGYYQSQLMTWIVKNIVHQDTLGWVFFLDADEFLPFESREEFNRVLAKYNASPVISMPWLNLVPLDMHSGAVIGGKFLKSDSYAAHCKIAFQPNLIPIDDYIVAQGNHALLVGANHSQSLPVERGFPIYHFPIRTKQQLRNKIFHGVESYRSMGKNRVEGFGAHWDEINKIMDRNGLTDELMAGMIVSYGEPMKPPYIKNISELMREGYSVIQVNSCYSKPSVNFNDIPRNQESRTDSLKQQRVKDVDVGLNEWGRITYDDDKRVLHLC
ncbi:MAG: hypothetical protein A2063_05635 [Gallionellales bacterium GWA2_60_142]|nr:MAG: hypothetical protein A2063_05635 [Gallionellales bacterium GWA2_60_142]HCI12768.1 hypothetical protein [Gallionellaceae bacterium]